MPFLQHGYGKESADAAQFNRRNEIWLAVTVTVGFPPIQDVYRSFFSHHPDDRALRRILVSFLGDPLGKRRGNPALRDSAEAFPVIQPQDGHMRIAQSCRILQNRLEYRLYVGRRAADDLQDLGRRRLLLERLLGLVEQPYVRDGDDRLTGKRLEQGDLSVGERLDLL